MTLPKADEVLNFNRSRRVYVYWGLALTLLIAAALFCWGVAVPFMQTRGSVERVHSSLWLTVDSGPAEFEKAVKSELEHLGGPVAAAGRLRTYLKAPKSLTPHRGAAVLMLVQTGEATEADLDTLAEHEEITTRAQAIEAMNLSKTIKRNR